MRGRLLACVNFIPCPIDLHIEDKPAISSDPAEAFCTQARRKREEDSAASFACTVRACTSTEFDFGVFQRRVLRLLNACQPSGSGIPSSIGNKRFPHTERPHLAAPEGALEMNLKALLVSAVLLLASLATAPAQRSGWVSGSAWAYRPIAPIRTAGRIMPGRSIRIAIRPTLQHGLWGMPVYVAHRRPTTTCSRKVLFNKLTMGMHQRQRVTMSPAPMSPAPGTIVPPPPAPFRPQTFSTQADLPPTLLPSQIVPETITPPPPKPLSPSATPVPSVPAAATDTSPILVAADAAANSGPAAGFAVGKNPRCRGIKPRFSASCI